MFQRNDTGETRMFPTLDPPIEVADGESVDHPVRLGGLTPVTKRGRVLREDEIEAGAHDDEDGPTGPEHTPAEQVPGGAFAHTKEDDQAAAAREAEAEKAAEETPVGRAKPASKGKAGASTKE